MVQLSPQLASAENVAASKRGRSRSLAAGPAGGAFCRRRGSSSGVPRLGRLRWLVAALVGAMSFVRQQEAKGLGHAIWTARHVIGDETFAVLLPDMLMVAEEPCLKSMMAIHERDGGNVLAVEKCRPEEAHKFGIVSLKPTASGPLVNGLVEKPAPGTAPSNFYISGRYILQPEVFALLDGQAPGAGGEIQLTDALIGLMETQEIRPYEFRGQTFDCGSPAGFVAANLALAMARPELAEALAPELDRYAMPARPGAGSRAA